MQSFVDETRITVSSGNGGAGSVSFRREKYVPKGGPDGGDGGRGGDVIFQVKKNLKTLFHLKNNQHLKAKNGEPGKGRKCHGKKGMPLIITVPPGTIVKDLETQEIYHDFSEDVEGQEWVFLKGGDGGLGNWHFRSSRKQSPRYAQPGQPGHTAEIFLELNLIGDIGLVGFPNAGKSSLLDALTNANPAIAPYPFTTKIPNLGVFRIYDRDIVIADIPGIIEGASHGAGLGFKFLKHISRSSCLAFLVDLTDPEPEETLRKLRKELTDYGANLNSKKHLIIGTKTDLEGSADGLESLKKAFPDENILSMSSFTGEGLDTLRDQFHNLTS